MIVLTSRYVVKLQEAMTANSLDLKAFAAQMFDAFPAPGAPGNMIPLTATPTFNPTVSTLLHLWPVPEADANR